MKPVLYLLLLVCSAVQAHAGQGTIRETETQIIIEYSGNENDKQEGEKAKEERDREDAAANKKQVAAERGERRVSRNEARKALQADD